MSFKTNRVSQVYTSVCFIYALVIIYNKCGCNKLLTVCLEETLINPARDDQLSASSVADNNHGPSRSPLHTQQEGALAGSWSAGSNTNTQWIQVYNNIKY